MKNISGWYKVPYLGEGAQNEENFPGSRIKVNDFNVTFNLVCNIIEARLGYSITKENLDSALGTTINLLDMRDEEEEFA